MANSTQNPNGTFHAGRGPTGPRCIALVGPFQSGKTTLLEAILARTGAISRQGSVADGSSVGDASREARAHQMSVELSIATTQFMGDDYTFLDCPGSIEFFHDMRAALPGVDAAIVVCEADERKLPQMQMILRELEDLQIPRFLFLNKIDKASARVRDIVAMLQPASRVPLLLRQIPIWKDDKISGFVDLALERAFVYHEHAPSEIVDLGGDDLDREKDARFSMLESLADHDDALMEQLLEDITPPQDRVFDDLSRELREGLVCPVLIGSAEGANGVLRLMKALRHEAPTIAETRARLGLDEATPGAYVMKTLHTSHGGKQSLARIISGTFAESAFVVNPDGEVGRVSGLFAVSGPQQTRRPQAGAGETVALGKLDHVLTGDVLRPEKSDPASRAAPAPQAPVMAISLAAADRKDDVKLGLALTRLHDEDPSLVIEHNHEAHEVLLRGQGEMHLRVNLERLRERFGISITQQKPSVGYRETIRKSITQRGRHKKQSGGHGQYGDVVIEVRPLGRGEGFVFEDKITGGVIPRNYIPAVEEGVRDAFAEGPLGFPVVDVAVALTDGSFHSVDSSDMAFRLAGRLAINEALPQCQPVLLEPIEMVEIVCPNAETAKINAIVSARRGQILGFESREGWPGWDMVRALMPSSELGDLIIEVRSATAGAGTFTAIFDHMAEVTGRAADQIVAARRNAA